MRNKQIEELHKTIIKTFKGCLMRDDSYTKQQIEKCYNQMNTKKEQKSSRAADCSACEESGNALCAGRTPARADGSAGACGLVSSHKSQGAQ